MYGGSRVAVAAPDEKLCPRTLYRKARCNHSSSYSMLFQINAELNLLFRQLLRSNRGCVVDSAGELICEVVILKVQ